MGPKSLSKKRAQARASLASAHATLKRNPDDPQAQAAVERLDREYRALSLEEHIAAVVDALPPLTSEQRGRLAALLRPATEAATAA